MTSRPSQPAAKPASRAPKSTAPKAAGRAGASAAKASLPLFSLFLMAAFAQPANAQQQPAQGEAATPWGLGVAVGVEHQPYRGIKNKTVGIPLLSYENQWFSIAGLSADLKLPSAGPVSAGRTWLLLNVTALCRQVATVHLYSSADTSREAGAWTMGATQSSARVRFVNLAPDTAYWYRVTWVAGPDAPVQSGPVFGPVRTATTDPVVTPTTRAGTGCPAVLPSLSLGQRTAYSLAFTVSFLCDQPATVRLFADPAGQHEVARWTVLPSQVTTGSENLVVTRLDADTAYWYGLSFLDPDSAPVHPLVGTMTEQISPVPPTSTTTTPTNAPCGVPYLAASDRTTLTFAVPPGSCPGFTLTLFSDAAGTSPVGAVSRAAGAASGDIRFGNLSSGTLYWYQASGAGWSGRVTPAAPGTSPAPSPSATVTCPPVQPSFQFAAATGSELQFAYQFLCGRSLDLHLYTDAAGTREVATVPMALGRIGSGTLDVTRLPAGTTFYWNYTQNGISSPIQGPARTTTSATTSASPSVTAVPSVCAAALRLTSTWGDGFTAEVEVRNTGTETIAWSVAWTWTGGESLAQAWNATAAGSATSPVLTGANWNRQLRPGESATAGLLGRGAPGTTPPLVTCTAA